VHTHKVSSWNERGRLSSLVNEDRPYKPMVARDEGSGSPTGRNSGGRRRAKAKGIGEFHGRAARSLDLGWWNGARQRWGLVISEMAVKLAVAIQSGMRAIIRAMSTRFREREQLCIEAANTINGAASSAPEPERSLLDAIAAGELDHHLTAIADAVHARRHLLHTVRSATALAELCIGDVVRINDTVSP